MTQFIYLQGSVLHSELRDQGLTRPKIVILVPFRDAALKVVEVIMQLICPQEGVRIHQVQTSLSLTTPGHFFGENEGLIMFIIYVIIVVRLKVHLTPNYFFG